MSGCNPGCSARGDYNGVPPPAIGRAPTRDVISQMLAVASMEKAAGLDQSEKQGRYIGFIFI